MSKNNFHKPIGISETRKGLSLSVADLLRKTSAQNIEALKLNSRLSDMFASGLTDVQEDKLLDFVPLQMSAIRDLTDLETAREEARAYLREQYQGWLKSKAAAERQRALLAQRQAAMQQQAQDVSLNTSPTSVETLQSAPHVQ